MSSGLGAGAVQANTVTLGAEQIRDSKKILRYFDKYIVAVNTGGLIAMLAVPYIQMDRGHYHHLGFIIAAVMLFLAAVSFIIGRLYYIYIPPYDTVSAMVFPVFFNAIQSWWKYKMNKRLRNKEQPKSIRMSELGSRISVAGDKSSIKVDKQSLTFLDYAKAENHGRFHDRIVENVKSLRGALVVFILLIPFWLIYDQVI